MSWSIGFVGTPEEVVEELNKHSELLTGDSKEEYDSALPHMIGLVEQNTGGKVRIEGHGHGSTTERDCTVHVQRVYDLE